MLWNLVLVGGGFLLGAGAFVIFNSYAEAKAYERKEETYNLYGSLARQLLWILQIDNQEEKDYAARYAMLMHAASKATSVGIQVGFRIDDKEPDFPVIFFETPAGQMSWHMPEHPIKWDGHTNEQKAERIVQFAKMAGVVE